MSDDINYSASLKLPDGWKFGTPLPVTSQSGNESSSPRFPWRRWSILRHHRRISESRPARRGSSHRNGHRRRQRRALDAPPEVWDHYKNLVEQAQKLFRRPPLPRLSLPLPRSAITSRTSAWSTTSPTTVEWTSAPWSMTPPAKCRPACCPTNMSTRGTESSVVPADLPRSDTSSPCRTICSGSTRA